MRFVWLLAFACGVLCTGCDPPGSSDTSLNQAPPPPVIIRKESRPSNAPPRRIAERPTRRSSPSGSTRQRSFDQDEAASRPAAQVDAAQRVLQTLEDAIDLGPTLVVWLVDVSPSAMNWHGGILGEIQDFYRRRQSANPGGEDGEASDRLLTSVVTFGQAVAFATEEPTADEPSVIDTLSSLTKDDSGRETTFAAIQQAVDRSLEYRIQQRREVLLVLVTDEAGDDVELLDQVIDVPRKYAIPIHVIGVPAPFGRLAGLSQSVEGGSEPVAVEGRVAVRQGPETPRPERIHLPFENALGETDLIDSGFGPYALEQLCQQTGGRFLAMRMASGRGGSFRMRGSGEWPSWNGPTFDAAVLRKYRPQQQSSEDYQSLISSNSACRALVAASKIRVKDVSMPVGGAYDPADPARLKTRLDQDQQVPAKISEQLDRLYETMADGMSGREELPNDRWRASFDLAMGRVTAAKARVDGYNDMLASLKRGRTFQNPSSTTWRLDRDDSIDTSSSLRSMIKRAKDLLEGVVRDHPGTPWAYLAEQELKTPMGWKWIEQ